MLRYTFVSIFILVMLFGVFGQTNADELTISGGGTFRLPAEGQFAKFTKWLFPALLVTAAILAVFMIILAGFQWVTAYGNPSKIEDARDRIFMAILGLILAFAAWLILNTINPALVNPTIFTETPCPDPNQQQPC